MPPRSTFKKGAAHRVLRAHAQRIRRSEKQPTLKNLGACPPRLLRALRVNAGGNATHRARLEGGEGHPDFLGVVNLAVIERIRGELDAVDLLACWAKWGKAPGPRKANTGVMAWAAVATAPGTAVPLQGAG